jgi:anti-anti-sigma factor
MSDYRRFHIHRAGDAFVLQVADSQLLDQRSLAEFREELIGCLETVQPRQVVVTFAGVRRISSAIINALLLARNCLQQSEGRLVLCGMRPEIREFFTVLRLDFEIHESLSDALRALLPAAEDSGTVAAVAAT